MKSKPNVMTIVIACLMFFLSGLVALIYEVLWMKELSLLFGNSAQAAAATLAAFFTGIAAGNAYWGRRASALKRPLFTYGMLELCVTASAIIYFAIYFAYDSLYPFLFGLFEFAPMVFTIAKFILALLLFFPAAFFMGGTLPVMTQFLVESRESLGKKASTLYAINTFGAASGAILAGFYLTRTLGTNVSYLLAMGATLLVGILAMILDSQSSSKNEETAQSIVVPQPHSVVTTPNVNTLTMLAFMSGFTSLALQVLWIRMLSQVLHNSIYTYSVILSVFLIALAFGGVVARQLANKQVVANWFLPSLLCVTGLLVASSPMLFYFLTDGGSYFSGKQDFYAYILQIFWLVITVIGVPTAVIGILLPYLFKLSESEGLEPGATVGRLVTVNTIGAILGSVVAGFILLDWIGLWSSLNTIATIYIIAAFWVLINMPVNSFYAKLAPVVALLLLVTVLDTAKLPIVKVDPVAKNETLLKVWEGSDATVAVVRRNGHLNTKLNNWYTLGGTGDMATQQMQSHLPLLLHPNPKRVFYLGLGTGITAGTSLTYKVDEVVVAEISSSVIKASKEFFTDYTNGLFQDARVKVVAEDGRNVLRGTQSAYDLIISDLFIPWKAGTGSLYSLEHYQNSRKRLNDDGMYVQWLPLYQLTKTEFAIIARTMKDVFPTVSMWRGNFSGNRAVVALIGHKNTSQLTLKSPLMTASRLALQEQREGRGDTVPLIAHYAGTLNTQDAAISDAPINTDSHQIIEYLAPINHRLEKANQIKWFVGEELFEFVTPLVDNDALIADPYLSSLNHSWHHAIQAGYYLQASYILKDLKKDNADSFREAYKSLIIKSASDF